MKKCQVVLPIILLIAIFIMACGAWNNNNFFKSTKATMTPVATSATDNTRSEDAQTPEVQQKTAVINQSGFPLPDGAQILSQGNKTLVAQVQMPIKDVVEFYRKACTQNGLKEYALLTNISEKAFSLVFSGSPNGKNLVIQGVDLGEGNTSISIQYE